MASNPHLSSTTSSSLGSGNKMPGLVAVQTNNASTGGGTAMQTNAIKTDGAPTTTSSVEAGSMDNGTVQAQAKAKAELLKRYKVSPIASISIRYKNRTKHYTLYLNCGGTFLPFILSGYLPRVFICYFYLDFNLTY